MIKIRIIIFLSSFFSLHLGAITKEIASSDQAAIMRAVRCGNIKSLKDFFAAGSNTNTIDHQGYSLLMRAIIAENYDTSATARFLLENGVNPAHQSYDGTTTLQLAVDMEKLDLASQIFKAIMKSSSFDLNSYKPSISFMITDLKFDKNGNLAILEFGEGTLSYFKGHDALYPKGSIWKKFWNYIASKNLPQWHIGNLVAAKRESDEIGLKEFKALGGYLHSSLHILEKEASFKHVIKSAREKNLSPAGIITLHHHTTNPAMLNYFKKTYPEIIIVNEVIRSFASNKFMTNLLFEDDPELSSFRPLCKTYPKKFSKELITKITTDFTHQDSLVIKPLNSANGWGVIITDKKNLSRELKTIFKKTSYLENSLDPSYTYWLTDPNHHFMIESFAHSKPIRVVGKKYDATMRQAFIVESNAEGIFTTFLGSYWKLPALSLQEAGSQTERHKSNVKSGRKPSELVDESDDRAVQKILHSILPQLYKKMMLCVY